MTETNETASDPALPSPALSRRLLRRRFTKLLALALVIFICGGAAGFGVAILCRRPPMNAAGFSPEPPVNEMVRRLQQELLLSDDQAKKVREIYQAREEALRSIHQKMQPEMKSEYDKLDQDMKQVLNPAQYQRWNERFQSLRNRIMPPGPPPFRGNGEGGPRGPNMGSPNMGGPPGFPGPLGGPGGPDGPGGPEDRPHHGPPPGDGPPPQ